MMFCGYWNKAYGDHFSKNYSLNNRDACHGPARVSLEELHDIFLSTSLKEIVTRLKEFAILDPDFKAFNHQNVWSRDELKPLVEAHGFRLISTDTDEICMQLHKNIPDLLLEREWSAYYLCEQVN